LLTESSPMIQLPPPSTAASLDGSSSTSRSIGAYESLPRYGRPTAARLAATSPFAPPPLPPPVPGQAHGLPLGAPYPPSDTAPWRPEVRAHE
jgi:hypothetical protein